MATRLLAPSFGEGVDELTVTNWLKKEGDPVKELEVIVELETDKVTTEIPSPATGVLLKVLAQKNEVVKVGSTLAWIGQPGEKLETGEPEKKPGKPGDRGILPTEPSRPVMAKSTYTGRVSPLVRKIVAENGVDLNLVQGTGLDGRITKEDVLKYLESRKQIPPGTAARKPEAVAASGSLPVSKPSTLPGELIPISSLRRQIAERMVNSQLTSPHVLTVMEADLSQVLAHRSANKAAFAAQGIDLTLTVYFCSAIITGLKACPDVNSSWTEEGIQQYSDINLGVATSLGDLGLIVPVIKDAGLLSLQGLAQKINDLTSRARSKKLLPDEVKDGTFTLTNYGSGGSLFASPIIYQPQAAILGTGMMQKRAVVVTDASGHDAIAIRPMIYLSLVFDHRILDGAGGDRFLKKVKDTLENWC
jgi:pyruvate/2-oxoglutarate dehydrogenase complex dihydrolipoamide acyltransferase (E2) component